MHNFFKLSVHYRLTAKIEAVSLSFIFIKYIFFSTVSEINTRLKELKAMIQNVERQHDTKDVLIKEIQEKEKTYKDNHKFAVDIERCNDVSYK